MAPVPVPAPATEGAWQSAP